MTTGTYESEPGWVQWERIEPKEEPTSHPPLIVGFMLRTNIADALLAVEREADAIERRQQRAKQKAIATARQARPMRFNEATGRWVGGT